VRATRFWELVATLDGIADEGRCDRLDALLRESGEAAAFSDLVEARVEELLATCPVPPDMQGSSVSEWLAAAVVAAGRATFDQALAAGSEIDADAFAWAEAEALLVVGVEPDDAESDAGPPPDHGEPRAPVDVTLQWLAAPAPERLVVPFDDQSPFLDLMGDSPLGRTPVHDPDWVEAQRRLAADPEVVARRAALAPTALGLTVRPYAAQVPESHDLFAGGARPVSAAAAYGFSGGMDPGVELTVVLVVPATDFPARGSRVEAYVGAVHRLLDEAEAGPS